MRGGRSGKGVAGVRDELFGRFFLKQPHAPNRCCQKSIQKKSYAKPTCRSDFARDSSLCMLAEVHRLGVYKQVANSSSTTSGVARCYPTATSERGYGWVGYLPLSLNARSEASEHALATERRKRQGCGVVYLHNAPICTLAIPTSIASGTYRRLVLHLQPHNCEHICACLL